MIGAAFNKVNQAKISDPIAGNGGVFVIKTENIRAVPNAALDADEMRQSVLQQQQNAIANPQVLLSIIRKSADIKDNRHRFF